MMENTLVVSFMFTLNQNRMKQKFLFIKMLWMVIRNKENGWMFFRMTEQQQKDFLNDVQDVDITFRYIGMDKKVVEKIVNRLETFKSE
jgi:hypothetical protein